MKYIILIFTIISLQNCKGQNDKKTSKLSQNTNLEVLSLSNIICGKNSSSQKDYSQIQNWKLSKNDVIDLIKNSKEISQTDWHYAYNNLPCEIIATIKKNGTIDKVIINAGGYYNLNGKIYGCKTNKCLNYFPAEAKNGDDVDNDTDIKNNQITNKSIINNKWQGNYTLFIEYGKIDQFSSISIEYDIEILDNKCTFAGMGYQTSFTDQCRLENNNDNQLILKYDRNIDSDGFTDHSTIDTLAILIQKKDKYYIKSKIIADKNWKYNVPISIDKK